MSEPYINYYIDYRTSEIVKDLDTTFLAPEMYNRVEVNDLLHASYRYIYADRDGRQLAFHFSQEEVKTAQFGFIGLLEAQCRKHNFVVERLVDKLMYVSQEFFDKAYQGGGITREA